MYLYIYIKLKLDIHLRITLELKCMKSLWKIHSDFIHFKIWLGIHAERLPIAINNVRSLVRIAVSEGMNIIGHQCIFISTLIRHEIDDHTTLGQRLRFRGSGRPFKVILSVSVLARGFIPPPPPPLGFCPAASPHSLWALRYDSVGMAHHLYFIRPWYNWWQQREGHVIGGRGGGGLHTLSSRSGP